VTECLGDRVCTNPRCAEHGIHWTSIEDLGGFPPWWQYGLRGRIYNDRIPWPSEWDRRPHP